MTLKKKVNKSDSLPEFFVYIIGKNIMLNELLFFFLKKETGIKGACILESDLIFSKKKNDSALSKLLIYDCRDFDMQALWNEVGCWEHSNSSTWLVALFNVDPEMEIERMAVENGVRGIFYSNESVQMIVKGICTILNDEYWYSRKTLEHIIVNQKYLGSLSKHIVSNDLLSFREKEMLILIALGHSNQEIADDLCISVHTVKTHIYNIYRKIKVANRFQAALWVCKYPQPT